MRSLLALIIVLALSGGGIYLWQINNPVAKQDIPTGETDSVAVASEHPVSKPLHRKRANNVVVDSIAIHKGVRELLAFNQEQLVKKYNVALGVNPVGKKEVEGDYKTPEGLYHICGKNPFSQYHKSLGISYPNEEDILHARALGKKTGGDIKIHGLMKGMYNTGKNHIKSNWTLGCVAVTNEEIDELFTEVKIGTPVFISP